MAGNHVGCFHQRGVKGFIKRYADHHVETPADKRKTELFTVFFRQPDADSAFDALLRFIHDAGSLELLGHGSAGTGHEPFLVGKVPCGIGSELTVISGTAVAMHAPFGFLHRFFMGKPSPVGCREMAAFAR
jgi:hypothetical protein